MQKEFEVARLQRWHVRTSRASIIAKSVAANNLRVANASLWRAKQHKRLLLQLCRRANAADVTRKTRETLPTHHKKCAARRATSTKIGNGPSPSSRTTTTTRPNWTGARPSGAGRGSCVSGLASSISRINRSRRGPIPWGIPVDLGR